MQDDCLRQFPASDLSVCVYTVYTHTHTHTYYPCNIFPIGKGFLPEKHENFMMQQIFDLRNTILASKSLKSFLKLPLIQFVSYTQLWNRAPSS
jgi:hypothetical protein